MKKFDSINVIPFIDIMLVLLAIVLTTATFVSTGQLDIDLPEATTDAVADDIDRVEIAIDRNGVSYVDEIEKTFEQIENLLKSLPETTPVLLSIDESVEFKQFVSLIDVLNRLSMNNVSVLTRKEN